MNKLLMDEAGLEDAIIPVAQMYGWKVTHFRPAMVRPGKWATPIQGDPGFFDLVMVKHVFLVAELKGYDKNGRLGQLEPEQWEWLERAQHCPGVIGRLWTPDDWISGEILKELMS